MTHEPFQPRARKNEHGVDVVWGRLVRDEAAIDHDRGEQAERPCDVEERAKIRVQGGAGVVRTSEGNLDFAERCGMDSFGQEPDGIECGDGHGRGPYRESVRFGSRRNRSLLSEKLVMKYRG